ncbi:nucleotidyltransferase family protein [Domibacillus enclensis]|uniref:Alcohol dehydrogenase n=1 Tax=Domibacillus enclensis TaxID=1017273 RepID=A0A1N6SBX0_9BACI|nr:nucleotidyltransferase family protein [Domibacillus enclensis]OXS79277.1 alcohol dehydrogenase [Domibacillus enclensis]SIQ38540.1 CBS domain-containing protein [Domibacillus enclensis]
MERWKQILISPNESLLETMKVIDKSTLQFAAVVDKEDHLLGTVTDGDIRRGILRGVSLDSPIKEVMNTSPILEKIGQESLYYKKVMKKRKLKQLPIVDDSYKIARIMFTDDVDQVLQKENIVVLMAGGLGTRLRPLTNNIPKPMLKVGDKPILETIIESFKSFGFKKFILCVNYKKELIQDYFQDGTLLGVEIKYIEETKRLGTAGALSLLNEKPAAPFFVMNGDLLTKINFEQLLDFHLESQAEATICVREYEYQIPFGVIETDQQKLMSIVEKPVHKTFVNAGIYVLNPESLAYVPHDQFFDMPDLFKILIGTGKEAAAFPLREYWLDIGHTADYEKADKDYMGNFLSEGEECG